MSVEVLHAKLLATELRQKLMFHFMAQQAGTLVVITRAPTRPQLSCPIVQLCVDEVDSTKSLSVKVRMAVDERTEKTFISEGQPTEKTADIILHRLEQLLQREVRYSYPYEYVAVAMPDWRMDKSPPSGVLARWLRAVACHKKWGYATVESYADVLEDYSVRIRHYAMPRPGTSNQNPSALPVVPPEQTFPPAPNKARIGRYVVDCIRRGRTGLFMEGA